MDSLSTCIICNNVHETSFMNIIGIQVCDPCYESATTCIKCKRKIYSDKMPIQIYYEWIQNRLCTVCTDNRHMRYRCKNIICAIQNKESVITNFSELPSYYDKIRSDGTLRLCNECSEKRRKHFKRTCKECKILSVRLNILCKYCKCNNLCIERRCFKCYKWIDFDNNTTECNKGNEHVL